MLRGLVGGACLMGSTVCALLVFYHLFSEMVFLCTCVKNIIKRDLVLHVDMLSISKIQFQPLKPTSYIVAREGAKMYSSLIGKSSTTM
jgi:hypothetical protein